MDTVLGMLHQDKIAKIYGSDVSTTALEIALKNASLLTIAGLEQRKSELKSYYDNFGKTSHLEAIQSCEHMIRKMGQKTDDLYAEFFCADATKPNEIKGMKELPDIILADVPYGNLVEWSNPEDAMIDQLFEALMSIARQGTVVAICSDKHQKISLKSGIRKEKQLIGKRKFEIYLRG
jgi:23S rRNA G2445 N2-methylase RlmL